MPGVAEPRDPLPLRWIRAHGLQSLTPWHFVDDPSERAGLQKEFRLEVSAGSQPVTDILPFARRQDCDDVAAFIVEAGTVTDDVVIVHLTWRQGPEQPGYPSIHRCRDFWDWLETALADTREWASEDELADL
jgi:hypothetical protein